MSLVTWAMSRVTARDLEIGGVVCVSLGVVVADGTQSGFRGVGAWGGAGGNWTYGDGISYNIIMRCNSASLST